MSLFHSSRASRSMVCCVAPRELKQESEEVRKRVSKSGSERSRCSRVGEPGGRRPTRIASISYQTLEGIGYGMLLTASPARCASLMGVLGAITRMRGVGVLLCGVDRRAPVDEGTRTAGGGLIDG